MTKKIAFLTSGMSRGSNFEAIVHFLRENNLPVEVSFVIVTRKYAPIIEKCEAFQIPSIFLKATDIQQFESTLTELIHLHKIDLLVLSGFLFKLSHEFIQSVSCPIVNIHPALLPKYGGEGMYGHFVHEAVFAAKEKMSGATVHWVNEDYDAGKIIAQQEVDITGCKSPEEIAAKVLAVEHELYGKTIASILDGKNGFTSANPYSALRTSNFGLRTSDGGFTSANPYSALRTSNFGLRTSDGGFTSANPYSALRTSNFGLRTSDGGFTSANPYSSLHTSHFRLRTSDGGFTSANPYSALRTSNFGLRTSDGGSADADPYSALRTSDFGLRTSKVAILTLGCKVNQYESACIISSFELVGYETVDFNEPADVYIINTCTVTNRTDYKSRNAIRKALEQKELNPQAKIVVTGCFSQRQYKQVKELGNIDLVVDNQHKDMIPELLESNRDCFSDILGYSKFQELSATQMPERSRAFIKVQDGCDFYCAYCAVPFARGHSRSREMDKIKEQISLLVSNGYQEFVLGGINLGLYGRDLEQKTDLAALLEMIEGMEGVEHIRISSIEPQLLTDRMWDFIKTSKKLCHHFHISMQSGSDTILSRMKRHYDAKEFRDIILKMKSIHPDMAIGLDVITGFPGETDELFNETLHFLEALPFTYLHVFSYSSRPGTEAAAMKDKVHGTVSTERNKVLHKLSETKLKEYLQYLILHKIPLSGVIETQEDGYWTALSDHFVRIYLPNRSSATQLKGELLKFTPKQPFRDGIEVTLYDEYL